MRPTRVGSRGSLQQAGEGAAHEEPLLSSDEPPPPPPAPPACHAALRASPWAAPCAALAHALLFSLLAYFHAGFSALRYTPGLQSATCAASLADGPCALGLGGGAACELRCPPRCSDLWVGNATAYAVWGGAGGVYRGDSKLCRAALHAGLLDDARGGCVRVAAAPGAPPAAFPAPQPPSRHGVLALPAPYHPLALALLPSRAPHCGGSLQWPWLAAALGAALASFALLPPRPAFLLTAGSCFTYLVFTARGGDPYALLLAGAGCAVSAGALLHCAYGAAVQRALEGAPLGLGSAAALHVLPLFAAAHMNLYTVVVPDFSFSAASLGALSAGQWGIVAALLAAVAGGVAYQARLLCASGEGGAVGAAYLGAGGALALASLALRGHAAVHVHHSLLALALLPLTRFPTPPSRALQGVLLGILLNGLAFWGVAGPWDAAGAPPPPPPPACSSAGAPPVAARLLGNGSVEASWPGCAPPPPGALYGLLVNGASVFAGAGSAVALQLPLGANVSIALQYVFADSSQSSASAATDAFVDR